jgi:carbon storage regulator
MLVLTRTPQQSFRIGPDIEVRVVSIRRGQVRLGIVAPAETKIVRSELTSEPSGSDKSGHGRSNA